MASSVPPSNPFDGFDSYSTVAAPAMPTMQQPHQNLQGAGTTTNTNGMPTTPQMPAPQQQYVPQEYQRAVASVAAPHIAGQMLPKPGARFPLQPGQQMPMQQMPVQQQPIVQQQQPIVQLQQQQLVPAAPSALSPWALPPAAAAAVPSSSASQISAQSGYTQQQQQQQQVMSMDPFAVQTPMQQPPPQQQQQLVPQYQNQQQLLSPQYQIPPHPAAISQQQTTTAQQRLQNEAKQFFNEQQPKSPSALPDEVDEEGLDLIDVELDEDENNPSSSDNLEHRKADGAFFGRNNANNNDSSTTAFPHDKNADIAPPPPLTPARPHAEYLARHSNSSSSKSSSAIASPLPNPSLVIHSGYVLSRISFRTVLLRKWKQTFWIQYGPTQLLFFRTFADYEDWLNNPYHSQRARDFLVKLRIDFVSDLKKSSVMGYQVTQIRRKPYNKNVMLHFKLERWMDYGPTIAAAFAAREEEMVHSPTNRRNNTGSRGGGGGEEEEFMNTTNDVASLRKIILGCMRNARDAALIASQGGGDPEDVYRGRYSTDREEYASPQPPSSSSSGAAPTSGGKRGSKIMGKSSSSRSSSKNLGFYQAFSAESTPRRKMNAEDKRRENVSPAEESVETEESAEVAAAPASNGVVDLLG